MNKIKQLILQKRWDLLMADYSAKDICSLLNFNESMRLMESLFFDDFNNDENQQYALKLAIEIRNHFKEEWEKDWKNDVYLGGLCSYLCLYDEQYFYYKEAYDKLTDPPAALLLLLAKCNSAPGTPPITEEESEYYLRKSAEKKITFETALSMRTLSEKKGDQSQYEYWDQLYKELKEKHICADPMIPDVFKVETIKKFISRKNWNYIISRYSERDIFPFIIIFKCKFVHFYNEGC